MPQSIILLLTLCWAAGCNVLGSADVDHLDMLQRGAASLESVEREEAATELEASSSNDGATDGNAGAPAPAPACKPRCQKKYDKFVKKGKAKQGFKRTCKKTFCAGCDFCADEPETPAPPAPAPAPAPAPEEELPEEEAEVDEPDTPAPPAPAPEDAGEGDVEEEEEADDLEEDEEEAEVDDEDEEASPAPAPKKSLSFTKVQENRYWACPRKGMGNTHGFGHNTVQECFAATLKDSACKGPFDYNQRYNGQCKCVVVNGCSALKGLGGYIAYKVADA
jgi:hypothetical protein